MRYEPKQKAKKKLKVDLKDKKILYELSKNARAPATHIAPKVGLSRDAVSYRIAGMEERGIIQGYKTIVDINKFGFDIYHIFLQLNSPTTEAEAQLIQKFRDYSFVRAVLKFSGKYDYELALIARSIAEFESILSKIIDDCANYLKHYEILIITKYYKVGAFPKNFLDSSDTGLPKLNITTKETKLDKVDFELMETLGDDAELPLYKIGAKLDLSADAVRYRMDKLKQQGIIINYVPAINYSTLGYEVYAVLINLQNLTNEKEKRLNCFFETDPNILWGVKTIGKYNILMYVCTQSPDGLHETMIALRGLFPDNIHDYETLIAYEAYKFTFFPKGISMQGLYGQIAKTG